MSASDRLTAAKKRLKQIEREIDTAVEHRREVLLQGEADAPAAVRVDQKIADGAHEAYAELVKRATDRDPDEDELAEMGAYAMAATVDFGLDAKQGLLDLRSENARLRLVTRLFRAAMKRLDMVDKAQERARSNGKVRFGG